MKWIYWKPVKLLEKANKRHSQSKMVKSHINWIYCIGIIKSFAVTLLYCRMLTVAISKSFTCMVYSCLPLVIHKIKPHTSLLYSIRDLLYSNCSNQFHLLRNRFYYQTIQQFTKYRFICTYWPITSCLSSFRALYRNWVFWER